MWSALPVSNQLRKLSGLSTPDIASVAGRSWELAPAHRVTGPRALFLPGQLERVIACSEFGTLAGDIQKVNGGTEATHHPTRAYLVRDAVLIDGVLYKGGACRHLHPRSSRVPRLYVNQEISRGAVYCTFGGNRFFGQWLLDDCATYALAAAEGTPVTTAQVTWPHTAGYEAWLDMTPVRTAGTFFRELIVFDDVGQNRGKHARFRALVDKLLAHVEVKPHPGVFIVRGQTGLRRVLRNELEIATRLRDRRGFTVIDPATMDVPAIVRACAGARIVVGVEGSGLIHGLLTLAAGAGLLVLQPPKRFSAIYKDMTDRDRQQFGFVVGHPDGDDFTMDADEVERTLDLFVA